MKHLQKVHQYQSTKGKSGENQGVRLARVLPIRIFMQEDTIIEVQDGNFFMDGKFVDEADLPSWVIPKLENLPLVELENLGMTRFSTEDLKNEEGDDPQQDEALVRALNNLDTEEDSHWTKKGRPDLNHLTEQLGYRVTRKMVNNLMPHLHRPE